MEKCGNCESVFETTLTSFSGEVEVPGAGLHLHLLVFELGCALPGYCRRHYQPPAVDADTAVLQKKDNQLGFKRDVRHKLCVAVRIGRNAFKSVDLRSTV